MLKTMYINFRINGRLLPVVTSQGSNLPPFCIPLVILCAHDDVIKWKHFPRNWPFVREIHRSPVNFPHKGQWRGALMFSLIYAWINDWVNNREAGELRRQHGHYDVIVMNIMLFETTLCRQSTTVSGMMKYTYRSDVLFTFELYGNIIC